MADKKEITEAHRIAKEFRQQGIEANSRLIGGRSPDVKVDSMIRDTARLNNTRLVKKYGDAIAKDLSSTGDFSAYDLRTEPKFYGR